MGLIYEKNREYFLKEAEKLINGPRAKDYGPVKKNHQRIADIWSVFWTKIKRTHNSRGGSSLYDWSKNSKTSRRH